MKTTNRNVTVVVELIRAPGKFLFAGTAATSLTR
jgi:hypothetical protein